MRTNFHDQLSALADQIGEMCGLAATAMERATHALLQADLSLAEQVIADQAHLVERSRSAEDSAVKLLALQQPVAGELRSIVCSMHIGADLERMGALAAHVAHIARLRHPQCAVPDEVRDCFSEMGTVAVPLARTAQEVLQSRDPARAAQLQHEDDGVDAGPRHRSTCLVPPA